MAVEYGSCAQSLSTLTDPFCTEENKVYKNLLSCKKCRKSSYNICLGTLAEMVHTQIQKKYAKNDRLYLIGSKYAQHFYKWVCQCKHKELLVNDFFKSFIASIALFALGAKLTHELAAWKVS